MFRTTELLVPQGILRVEENYAEHYASGELAALSLTYRAAHLNGQPVYWSPGTRDLLESAADALRDWPLPVPLIGAGR